MELGLSMSAISVAAIGASSRSHYQSISERQAWDSTELGTRDKFIAALVKAGVPSERFATGATPPTPTPTRTVELDTHRDRLWVRSALEAAGFTRGVASDVALTVQFQGAESPEEALARAKELAHIVAADSKGKLTTSPQPPHPKKPPKVGR